MLRRFGATLTVLLAVVLAVFAFGSGLLSSDPIGGGSPDAATSSVVDDRETCPDLVADHPSATSNVLRWLASARVALLAIAVVTLVGAQRAGLWRRLALVTSTRRRDEHGLGVRRRGPPVPA